MARKLDRLGIDAEIVERLAKHNINTVHDYYRVSMSPLLLMNYTNLSLIDLKRLSTLISNKTHVKPSTALEMLHSRSQMKRFLSTGIESFDRNMRGGLLVGCINEIVGAPGRFVGVCAGACLTNSTTSYTIAISNHDRCDYYLFSFVGTGKTQFCLNCVLQAILSGKLSHIMSLHSI
jgi:hypothetical protein